MISKELFIECIEKMKEQYYDDCKNSDLVAEAFNVEHINCYDNGKLYKTIIKLLRIYFPMDSTNFCEVDHYCFSLDFGKIGDNYESPEELYDRLIQNKQHENTNL